jgi:hypothetical protein
VSGNKQSASFGNSDYWLVKTDASGDRQREKVLGGSQEDQVTDAIITADEGYLVAGYSYSPMDGLYLDAQGSVEALLGDD